MPRTNASFLPKYQLHRASGQAVVTIAGRDFYLGQHDSPASRREYDRLIGKWMAAGRQMRSKQRKFDPDRRLFKSCRLGAVIRRACRKIGIPFWCPYQLRHLAATRLRAHFGIEAAQVLLGHSHLTTTEIYAKKNEALAIAVMASVG